ncbi:TetR/AcrR family transcriptional regulator [Actinomadura meridiana]|uniref:TetR/AcrR family transcriptional regulator n=1 Tax=Actinomadura meridiana TaxID=559626 RepID=A0ABP8CEU3_9ACTN
MAGRRRWTTEEILDTAVEMLRTGDVQTFSMRQLAIALGTDSSSLYRHFRTKTELMRALADRVVIAAMADYRPEGDWKQRIVTSCLRIWDAFAEHPQLATIWGRYASSGLGSRLAMEEALQALQASGLPDEEIPAHYHRLAVLLLGLVSAGTAFNALRPEEFEQGLESFRVAVLGADPDRFPALSHFARDLRPVGADRRAAFEEILTTHLNHLQSTLPQTPTG